MMDRKMFTTDESNGSSSASTVKETKSLTMAPCGSVSACLNEQLERGAHAPTIGGYKSDPTKQ